MVEGGSGFAAYAAQSTQLPFHGYLLLVGPAFSALGVLFLWIGRHELNELHRTRVGYAGATFVLSLVAIALAAAPIAYLVAVGAADAPEWLELEFGAAIALIFATTFVTYAFVASHLVGRVGSIALRLGLAWALLVAVLIGNALSTQVFPIVLAVNSRSTALDAITHSITFLDALLGLSYLAFFVAFAEAHYRVAKGTVPAAT